ncbi:MAG: heme o synthase [Candidatus Saccharimonadales bacterium]
MSAYYQLAKPGIIYGNALTAAAGFLLASSIAGSFEAWLFVALLLGTSLVIACGCVINNYLDRPLDKRMARTKRRASVTGAVPTRSAMLYAVILGIAGFAILASYTNALTVGVGVTGLFFYLVMYSVGKRRSVWGTVVGSVSGATPILASYTAVTNRLDAGGVILFLIMVLWQMPHFYAIALYRFEDYKNAGLPVLPVVKGVRIAKLQIIAYIIAFALAIIALTAAGYTGYLYLLIMLPLSFWWLVTGLKSFNTPDSKQWGRTMFLASLKVVLVLSVMTALGALLP